MNISLNGSKYSIPTFIRICGVRVIWVIAVVVVVIAKAIISFAEAMDDRPDRWQDDYRR